jgi:hypothetical protein
MSYSYSLETDLGKLRLLIQDTDVSSAGAKAVYSDEELTFFLSQTEGEDGNNIYLAAAHALETLAAEKARLAKVKKMDVLSNDTTKIAEQLLMLADRYKQKALELTDVGEVWSTSVVDSTKWVSSLLGLEITGVAPESDTQVLADLLKGSDA